MREQIVDDAIEFAADQATSATIGSADELERVFWDAAESASNEPATAATDIVRGGNTSASISPRSRRRWRRATGPPEDPELLA